MPSTALNTKQAILTVEDEPTRQLYLRALSGEYQVFSCLNEHDALVLFRTQPICAVVLEPALLNGQGWSLLAALQQMRGARAVPIVVCSTLDERRRGLSMGATTYLRKPVLPATLLHTLRSLGV